MKVLSESIRWLRLTPIPRRYGKPTYKSDICDPRNPRDGLNAVEFQTTDENMTPRARWTWYLVFNNILYEMAVIGDMIVVFAPSMLECGYSIEPSPVRRRFLTSLLMDALGVDIQNNSSITEIL